MVMGKRTVSKEESKVLLPGCMDEKWKVGR